LILESIPSYLHRPIINMNNSQKVTGIHGVLRAVPPPAILPLSTPQTQVTPDNASPVVEVNRSPQTRPRTQIGIFQPNHGNNDTGRRAPRPQVLHAQSAVSQHQSSFVNNSVQISNTSRRQWNINGRNDYEISAVSRNAVIANGMQTTQGASALLAPIIQHGGLGESMTRHC